MNQASVPENQFASLPLELIDVILNKIGSRDDLISLARTSSFWFTVIIPNHSEHREGYFHASHPEPWRNLHKRLDLAERYREVFIHEGNADHFYEWSGGHRQLALIPSKFHRRFRHFYELDEYNLDISLQPFENGVCDDAQDMMVNTIFSSFTSLRGLVWIEPYTSTSLVRHGEVDAAFSALRRCSTLRSLALHDGSRWQTFGDDYIDVIGRDDNPLWYISDLEELILSGALYSALGSVSDNLVKMLLRSPNLHTLELAYSYENPYFTQCRFPHLRVLHLTGYHTRNFLYDPQTERVIIDFLLAHSTIQDLAWMPRDSSLCGHSPSFLPNLRRIRSRPRFALDLVKRPRKLEYAGFLGEGQYFIEELSDHASTEARTHLRELHIEIPADADYAAILAETFPNLRVLNTPGFSRIISYNPSFPEDKTLDACIAVLSSFPLLECLCNATLWTRIQSLSPARSQFYVEELVRSCPNLTRIVMKRRCTEIVIMKKSNGAVVWDERRHWDRLLI